MSQHTFRSLALLTAFALGALGPALAPPAASAQRRSAPTTAVETPPAAEGVVNIQTATAEELQRLPGIGPSTLASLRDQVTVGKGGKAATAPAPPPSSMTATPTASMPTSASTASRPTPATSSGSTTSSKQTPA